LRLVVVQRVGERVVGAGEQRYRLVTEHTSDLVTRHCRERLADHKVPRSIVFVEMLPRNARGKLDREALARLTA